MKPASPLLVAHVVHRLDPGGLETLVMQMVTHADPAVVRPIVFSLSGIGALGQAYRDRVEIIDVPANPGYDLRAMWTLRNHFRRLRPDVIHSHGERPHLFATIASLGAGKRGPVQLNTVHLVYANTSAKAVLRRRALARATDMLAPVGDRVRLNLLTLDRIPPEKVRTIRNGTPLDAPRMSRADARRALGLSDHAFVVGAVGRLAPVKDHRTLLAALDRARGQIPGLTAVIVGEGELGAELRRLASERHLGDSIRFAGYRADAPALLSAFDVFAQPSLSEGISLSLLEASAAGLPVIATAVDGNLESVTDGETGLLVPVGDAEALAQAILRLAADPSLRDRMGADGRRYVREKFSFARMTREYEAMYLELVRLKNG